jgi:hypothetical protein
MAMAIGSILRRATCFRDPSRVGRIGRDSPRVCWRSAPSWRDALEVAKVAEGKAAGAALVPLPEEGAGSTAVEHSRSRISALSDRW